MPPSGIHDAAVCYSLHDPARFDVTKPTATSINNEYTLVFDEAKEPQRNDSCRGLQHRLVETTEDDEYETNEHMAVIVEDFRNNNEEVKQEPICAHNDNVTNEPENEETNDDPIVEGTDERPFDFNFKYDDESTDDDDEGYDEENDEVTNDDSNHNEPSAEEEEDDDLAIDGITEDNTEQTDSEAENKKWDDEMDRVEEVRKQNREINSRRQHYFYPEELAQMNEEETRLLSFAETANDIWIYTIESQQRLPIKKKRWSKSATKQERDDYERKINIYKRWAKQYDHFACKLARTYLMSINIRWNEGMHQSDKDRLDDSQAQRFRKCLTRLLKYDELSVKADLRAERIVKTILWFHPRASERFIAQLQIWGAGNGEAKRDAERLLDIVNQFPDAVNKLILNRQKAQKCKDTRLREKEGDSQLLDKFIASDPDFEVFVNPSCNYDRQRRLDLQANASHQQTTETMNDEAGNDAGSSANTDGENVDSESAVKPTISRQSKKTSDNNRKRKRDTDPPSPPAKSQKPRKVTKRDQVRKQKRKAKEQAGDPNLHKLKEAADILFRAEFSEADGTTDDYLNRLTALQRRDLDDQEFDREAESIVTQVEHRATLSCAIVRGCKNHLLALRQKQGLYSKQAMKKQAELSENQFRDYVNAYRLYKIWPNFHKVVSSFTVVQPHLAAMISIVYQIRKSPNEAELKIVKGIHFLYRILITKFLTLREIDYLVAKIGRDTGAGETEELC